MKLEFDPSLIEEVVFGELKARGSEGGFCLCSRISFIYRSGLRKFSIR